MGPSQSSACHPEAADPSQREGSQRRIYVVARFRLSLADAFAAARAREKKAELVTGDPEFKPLDQEIKIHWLK